MDTQGAPRRDTRSDTPRAAGAPEPPGAAHESVRALPGQPVVRRLAVRDGRELSLRIWPGRGRPMVLLHGLLDEAAGWDDLARSTSRPVIAIDLPGFGASDQPSRPRLTAYAADVADAIRALGVLRFTLVGHSLGGGVAAHVAEMLPARVGSLVLLAPAGFGPNPIAQAASAPGVRLFIGPGLALVLSSPLLFAGMYATAISHLRPPSPAMMARMSAQARRVGRGAEAATVALAAAAVSERALFRRRVRYDGPVCALWGEHDRLVPAQQAAGVRHAFPHAEVSVWAGMGHHPQHERPEQLAAFVEACCRSPKRPARGRRTSAEIAARRRRRLLR
jgi:pimeloyl-ACP methyl ester carboxylesterase